MEKRLTEADLNRIERAQAKREKRRRAPTKVSLQQSALELLDRLIECGSEARQ